MFRIDIFLTLKNFLKSFFLLLDTNSLLATINKSITKQSKKKYVVYTNQGRVGFLHILKYLKKNKINKKEIIFTSYNLPEMINVAKNLNFKIRFCDIVYKTGCIDLKNLKRTINNKTSAIVLTNMFNDYSNSLKIKKIIKKMNITLIEDNAIYFDNFKKRGRNYFYSGSIGDYTIYSFNIMKNISALYGGAVATNNLSFYNYYHEERNKQKSFPSLKLLNQIFIYFILKIMSLKFLYRLFFIHIIKTSHTKNIKVILKLFYPSLRFRKYKFNKSYFTNISKLSLCMIYLQIKDYRNRALNFTERKRKNIYYKKSLENLKNINLIKIKDFNYQNFIDFPILVKNKKKLNDYLLKDGIEIRYLYYQNCEKIFINKIYKCNNSEKYEKELICLPNNKKITFQYIDRVVNRIKLFYKPNV